MQTPSLLPIGLNQAQVWAFPLVAHPNETRALSSLLSPDEAARADRFVTTELRDRFTICRGRLRVLLGLACEMNPADIRFQYGQWGKPGLANRTERPLSFNVSHSQDAALIAIGANELGVDLEMHNPRIKPRSIASQVLHATEKKNLEQLPAKEQADEIMRLWVCKEALLKALGLGIAEGLLKTAFPIPIPQAGRFPPEFIDATLAEYIDDDGTCRMSAWIDAQAWRLELFQPFDNCVAAIAVQRSIKQIQFQDWPAAS